MPTKPQYLEYLRGAATVIATGEHAARGKVTTTAPVLAAGIASQTNDCHRGPFLVGCYISAHQPLAGR